MPKAYQTLGDDFVQHIQANSARGIDPFDLCKIVAWKYAQAVAEITVNSPDLIRTVTADAWHAVQDWLDQDVVLLTQANSMDWEGYQDAVMTAVGSQGAGTGLMRLNGIRYPVASAILRVWNRKAFPVIDRHAVNAVSPYSDAPINIQRGAGYVQFVRTLATTDHFGPGDIHDRDKQAMDEGKPA